MPFTPASVPEPPRTGGSGFTFGMLISKRNSTARLFISADAQKRVFGGSIIGKKLSVAIGRGTDEGKLLIQVAKDGDFDASGSIKGAAVVKMKPWDLLPKDKRPSGSCPVLEVNGMAVKIKLPDWCCPSKSGGKMDAEFGLKSVRKEGARS